MEKILMNTFAVNKTTSSTVSKIFLSQEKNWNNFRKQTC
ncbi:Predicted protein [Listeria monocytogenes]|nr:Predicted protein [Listeria monocytogenes]